MSRVAAAVPEAVLPAAEGRVFGAVLAGVTLDGEAARLAAMIDPSFLAAAGWDPAGRVLSLPAGHPLLGWRSCRVRGCDSAARVQWSGVCWRCMTRLKKLGMTGEQIAGGRDLPPRPAGEELLCAVPGCRREATGFRRDAPPATTGLCRAHKAQFHRKKAASLEEYLAAPGVRPLGPDETCAVTSCSRPGSQSLGYCPGHYLRWRQARSAAPGLGRRAWEQAESPVARAGQVSLHGLPPLVTVQVLFGLWRRTGDGVKTPEASLRSACRVLAGRRAASVSDFDAGRVPDVNIRGLLRGLARYARLALSDPDSERALDVWDLEVFGHVGSVDFTVISQPWLRESAKRWAAQDLPRHRGRGSWEVRNAVNDVGRLSESLSLRPDRGDVPAALSRRDIENFLNRLGYLESAGTISRYQRAAACRSVRIVLDGTRLLGLDGPGQPAAGLPGGVAVTVADIPERADPGEPGRDLPRRSCRC